MKNMIAAALVTVELEETIMSKFKAAIDKLEKNNDDFLLVADGVQVRVNKEYFTCLSFSMYKCRTVYLQITR